MVFHLIATAATVVAMVSDQSARAAAQHDAHHPGQDGDSAAVAATVGKYHDALSAGDSSAALALLADNAVILESGGVETRAEYHSNHLLADIRAAQRVRSARGPIRVRVNGDVAWASSTSSTEREVNGQVNRSTGAELMVLVRAGQEWKIAAIHWSSRARRPSGP